MTGIKECQEKERTLSCDHAHDELLLVERNTPGTKSLGKALIKNAQKSTKKNKTKKSKNKKQTIKRSQERKLMNVWYEDETGYQKEPKMNLFG